MKALRMRSAWLAFGATVVVLAALNVILSAYAFRLDLTGDRRYTINPATKKLLKELKDPIYIEVYLEGDFPAGFERLQRTIRETLEEFKVYAGDNIRYVFIDPSAETDVPKRNQLYQRLAERGLQPTNLQVREAGKATEKIIFPGAIVQLGGKEEAVGLLKGNKAASPQQQLNQSVESVEYELALAIRKVSQAAKKRVAVITGHKEHVGAELNDLAASLKGLVELEKVDLPKKISLDGYAAALVIKPDSGLNEPDKYKLDQLLVNGGALAYFIDVFKIRLDSIKPDGSLVLATDLNLDDQLFKYGARLNTDLVLDLNCAYIPMVVGMRGDQPETQAVPWRFFPIVNTFGSHPIVKNQDAIITKFVSSIDTVAAAGIRKTVLASTGKYSRIMAGPIRMSFNEARLEPDPAQYAAGPKPVAVLLEGSFTSLYAGRLAPKTEETFKFKERGMPGKVLLVADGDVPLNEVNPAKKMIYPLGFDRISGITFGNKDFVLNAITYMLDEDGLVLARNKHVELRPLDKPRLTRQKGLWQAINVGGPLALLALFGIVRAWRRRE